MPYVRRDNNPSVDKLLYVLGPAGPKGDIGPPGPPDGLAFTDIKDESYQAQLGEFVRVGGDAEGVRTITLPAADSVGKVGIVLLSNVTCQYSPAEGDLVYDGSGPYASPISVDVFESITLATAGDGIWIIISQVP